MLQTLVLLLTNWEAVKLSVPQFSLTQLVLASIIGRVTDVESMFHVLIQYAFTIAICLGRLLFSFTDEETEA